MEKTDKFGDKIKMLEMKYAGEVLDFDSPFCVRIDGKAFHTYTRGLERPYDKRLSDAMISTMNFLLEKSDAKLGYTQSDEINLIFFKTAPHQQYFFGSRIQKITSILSSFATAHFNTIINETIPEKKNHLAFFDARAWSVPSLEDAADLVVWRQEDAIKNAITMAASSQYSHKMLHKKSGLEKIQMMAEKGIDWNDYPDFFKSGTFAMKKYIWIPMTEEMKKFPGNEDKTECLRSEIVNFSLPRIKKIENYNDFLFNPIFEQHKIAVNERNIRKKKNYEKKSI